MIVKELIPTPTLSISETRGRILISIARAPPPFTPQNRARIVTKFTRGFGVVFEPVMECFMLADILTVVD
jgi:hypothetical protein